MTRVSAFLLCVGMLVGCSGGGVPQGGTVIGPAGGTVTGPGGASVAIPPGALLTEVTIAIEQTTSSAPAVDGKLVVVGVDRNGSTWNLGLVRIVP